MVSEWVCNSISPKGIAVMNFPENDEMIKDTIFQAT
jgi:hypothetical protein